MVQYLQNSLLLHLKVSTGKLPSHNFTQSERLPGMHILQTAPLSITTSQHQTVAAAPLPPTTPMSHAPIYLWMVANVYLLCKQWSVETLQEN